MFYKNITARRGGAAYSFEGTHDLGGSYTTDYIIDNDKFYGNYTSSEPTIVANGGAIYANEAPLTVQNCTFIENKTTQATSKGGAIFTEDGKFTSSNCKYINNDAYHSGGAINHEGNFSFSSTNDTFYNNKAGINASSGTRGGGAVYFYQNLSNIAFNGCEFLNNQSGRYGGAINVQGAWNTDSDLNVLNNCKFWGNIASVSYTHLGNKTIRFIGGFPVPNEFTSATDTCNICVEAYPTIIDIEPTANASVIRIGPSAVGSPVETQSTNVYFRGLTYEDVYKRQLGVRARLSHRYFFRTHYRS